MESFPPRKFVVQRCGKTVPRVEQRWTVLRLQIAWILRESCAGYEVDSVRGVVERLRPNVARETRESARALDICAELQRMVVRRTGWSKLVDRLEVAVRTVAVCVRFVQVREANESSALASHVTDFDGCVFRQFLLHVQVPVLCVRRAEFSRRHEHRIRSASGISSSGWGTHHRRIRAWIRSVKGGRIEIHRQYRFRTDWIRRYSGGTGEVRDQ